MTDFVSKCRNTVEIKCHGVIDRNTKPKAILKIRPTWPSTSHHQKQRSLKIQNMALTIFCWSKHGFELCSHQLTELCIHWNFFIRQKPVFYDDFSSFFMSLFNKISIIGLIWRATTAYRLSHFHRMWSLSFFDALIIETDIKQRWHLSLFDWIIFFCILSI